MLSDYKLTKDIKRSIPDYDLVIAGSSIVSGRWKSGVKKFLGKYRGQFKHLAIFVTAGGTMNTVSKGQRTKEEAVETAIERYIEPVKKKFDLTPLAEGVFGGQYGKEPKVRYNNWNKEDILHWAEQLNMKISESDKYQNTES